MVALHAAQLLAPNSKGLPKLPNAYLLWDEGTTALRVRQTAREFLAGRFPCNVWNFPLRWISNDRKVASSAQVCISG